MIKKSILLISLLLFLLPACEQIADVDRGNDISIATEEEVPTSIRAATTTTVTLNDSYYSNFYVLPRVFYNANGADSGFAPFDITKYRKGDIVTVAGSYTLKKNGKIFGGWTTFANGTGTFYDPGDTFVIGTSNIQLYAQWLENIPTFSLTFGGSGFDYAKSIQQTSDGGYIIAGYSGSYDGDVTGNHGASDACILKLNSFGVIEWSKTFGGSYNDEAYSIQQTNDGGYIIAGYSGSYDGDVTGNHGGYDAWILKLNASGKKVWSKTFGGSDYDEAHSIQQTIDGGYIIAGHSYSNDGDVTGKHGNSSTDCWILKLTTQGDKEWSKVFGGSRDDKAYSMQQTSDGGYIIAGETHYYYGKSDVWFLKLNAQGDIQWVNKFCPSGFDIVNSIQQTTDGGFITCISTVCDHHDCLASEMQYARILKLNAQGEKQWSKTYGGLGFDVANSIQQTTDGGFIIAGTSNSSDGDCLNNHGGHDGWILKLNAQGDKEWSNLYGGSRDDLANNIQQTKDGGFIIAGGTVASAGVVSVSPDNYDFWILKFDNNGNPKGFSY